MREASIAQPPDAGFPSLAEGDFAVSPLAGGEDEARGFGGAVVDEDSGHFPQRVALAVNVVHVEAPAAGDALRLWHRRTAFNSPSAISRRACALIPRNRPAGACCLIRSEANDSPALRAEPLRGRARGSSAVAAPAVPHPTARALPVSGARWHAASLTTIASGTREEPAAVAPRRDRSGALRTRAVAVARDGIHRPVTSCPTAVCVRGRLRSTITTPSGSSPVTRRPWLGGTELRDR